ncbi:MAG: hypothetical protein ACRD16_05695 [Thermoanaerobaculia bacterium]
MIVDELAVSEDEIGRAATHRRSLVVVENAGLQISTDIEIHHTRRRVGLLANLNKTVPPFGMEPELSSTKETSHGNLLI